MINFKSSASGSCESRPSMLYRALRIIISLPLQIVAYVYSFYFNLSFCLSLFIRPLSEISVFHVYVAPFRWILSLLQQQAHWNLDMMTITLTPTVCLIALFFSVFIYFSRPLILLWISENEPASSFVTKVPHGNDAFMSQFSTRRSTLKSKSKKIIRFCRYITG